MTIPYDVSVNGVWLSTIGVSLDERRLPVLPSVETNIVKMAGTDGDIDFGGTYGGRTMELTFFITSTAAEFHRTLTKLARIFNGDRRELSITFADIPERTYRVVNHGTLALDGQVGSRLVTVSLKANDPWPESEDSVTEVNLITSGAMIKVESDGDVVTYPVMTLENIGNQTIKGIQFTNEYVIGGNQ